MRAHIPISRVVSQKFVHTTALQDVANNEVHPPCPSLAWSSWQEALREGDVRRLCAAPATASARKLGRDVAIKVLPPSFASDPDRLTRFTREARLLAALNHPHIATIHGLEDAGGAPAIVMELVEGPTLADTLAHRARGVARACQTPPDLESVPVTPIGDL